MSLDMKAEKPLVLKALHWLEKQPHNWSSHIKDSNVAVRMYLKSQKKKEGEMAFQKELQDFVKGREKKEEATGAQIIKKDFSPKKADRGKEEPALKDRSSLSFKTPWDLNALDERSLEALDLVKDQLNLQNKEEALRALIQLGLKHFQKNF